MLSMRLILLVICMFLCHYSLTQKNVQLIIIGESSQQIKKNYETKFKDTISVKKYLTEFQNTAYKKGYLLASFDSILLKNSTDYNAYFNLGPKFSDAILRMDPDEIRYVHKNSFVSEKLISKTPVSPVEFERILREIHKTYINDGYPFAKIQLDSVELMHDHIEGKIVVQRNQYMEWQKIHVKGDSSISTKYVSNLIGIRVGDVYRESDFESISVRLKQVNFLHEIKSSEVLFTQAGAELFVYLESKPISSANGIIGLQPNSTTGKLSVTGEVNLKLINIIKQGEALEVDWRSIQPQTQALIAHLNYPFLFKTSFGLDGKFNLYKRDSTFLELTSTAGVNYFLRGGNYIKAFYQNNTSNLLNGSGSNINVANLATVKTNSYGLAFFRRQLDYVPNPSSGIVFNIEGSVGRRKSQINDSSEVVFATVYRASSEIDLYILLTRRNVLRIRNQTNAYFAPEIFANEVHRFGGLNIQRGFNEEELYSTTQTTFTLEYRFLVDQNSHAFAFFDQSWYENNSVNYINDHPFGFGLGFSFGTNFGIFSISYALGKQLNNAILLRDGKIHFGYIAYF